MSIRNIVLAVLLCGSLTTAADTVGYAAAAVQAGDAAGREQEVLNGPKAPMDGIGEYTGAEESGGAFGRLGSERLGDAFGQTGAEESDEDIEHPADSDTESDAGTGTETDADTEEPEREALPEVSVKLKAETGKSALIQWTKVDGAVSYEVQRAAKKNGTYKKAASLGSKRRSYTDQKVDRGNYYYYRVAAVMADGGRRYSSSVKFACPLARVSSVGLIRYSTSSIKVVWKEMKQAACYKVYYAAEKSGRYKLAGTTKNPWYRVKKLKNNQTYYFRVRACASEKESELDSADSPAADMKTCTYKRTTIFAGDSITTGLTAYGAVDQIGIGGNKKVVASVGLNTTSFRTGRDFSGRSALETIAATRPYRVYIMLGTNEISYQSSGRVIDGYRKIVESIKKQSPDTDIVLLAVPPVTRAAQQSRTGFQNIPELNQKLEKMAEESGVHYYDWTAVVKDGSGCLDSRYSAGDGIHWTYSAYQLFAKQIEDYDKSLD